MEDAEGASSSRQPDDRDAVNGDATDDAAIEDAEVVDDATAAPDETTGDEDPAAEGEQDAGDVAGESPARLRPSLPTSEPARSRVIAGAAAGAVVLLGLLGALIGRGGGLESAAPPADPPAAATSEPAATSGSPVTSEPTATSGSPVTEPNETVSPTSPAETPAPVVTEPPSTPLVSDSAPVSTPAPDTTTAGAAGVTTLLPDPSATTTTVPASAQLVGQVVPDVAAYPEALDDVAQAQRIAELATTARNDVASPGPVGTLCAVVRLQEQAQLEGRWEHDGDEVDSTNLSTVGEPGFGDCLVAEDGTPLDEGAYQFIVADRDGNDSAAGTFVVGAVPLEQIFVNTSTEQVCVLRLGPSSAGHYDAYDFGDEPLVPGASVIVPIADVDHEVRVDGCDPEADPIAEFDFNPAAGVPQPLVD